MIYKVIFLLASICATIATSPLHAMGQAKELTQTPANPVAQVTATVSSVAQVVQNTPAQQATATQQADLKQDAQDNASTALEQVLKARNVLLQQTKEREMHKGFMLGMIGQFNERIKQVDALEAADREQFTHNLGLSNSIEALGALYRNPKTPSDLQQDLLVAMMHKCNKLEKETVQFLTKIQNLDVEPFNIIWLNDVRFGAGKYLFNWLQYYIQDLRDMQNFNSSFGWNLLLIAVHGSTTKSYARNRESLIEYLKTSTKEAHHD